MQYLLHDLLKLPLADRLVIVENIICSLSNTEYEDQLKKLLDTIIINK